jgi:hypothetical protein
MTSHASHRYRVCNVWQMTWKFLAVRINTRFWICWHVPLFIITLSNQETKTEQTAPPPRIEPVTTPKQIVSAQSEHGIWGTALRRWVVHFTLRSIYPQLQGQNFRQVGTHTILHPWRREHKYANSISISSFVSVITGVRNGRCIIPRISVHTSPRLPPSRETRASHVMWPSITSPSPLRLKQTCQESQTQYHPQGHGLSRLAG